ncbi:MAG: hypothetical protein O2923_02380 [Verrucomicrobia bacterium]|nr:hypothetical protein [Verrucomicrobiota bacterium]MDA1085922.1 hypothetical protein [Verrucomicrobiota bacterium]
MKKLGSLGALLAAIIAMVGCEGWESGSDVFTWDDSFAFANFNGLYRPVDSSTIVFGFSAQSSFTSDTNATPTTIENAETTLAQGDGSSIFFASSDEGFIMSPVVLASSVTIDAGGFEMQDDGEGNLSADDGSTGTIDYTTGGWTLSFVAPPANGVQIIATYTFSPSGVIGTSGSGGSGSGIDPDTAPGSDDALPTSGNIVTFILRQTGNLLTIIDSNGDSYNGQMESLDFTRSSANPNITIATDGPIVGQATMHGVSQGVGVTMFLTLNGTLFQDNFADRIIQGTWVQEDGRTADIFGAAPTVTVIQDTVGTGTNNTANTTTQ